MINSHKSRDFMTTVGMKYPSLYPTSSQEYLSMLERVNEPTGIYPIENIIF
jgi:hypothetical protein